MTSGKTKKRSSSASGSSQPTNTSSHRSDSSVDKGRASARVPSGGVPTGSDRTDSVPSGSEASAASRSGEGHKGKVKVRGRKSSKRPDLSALPKPNIDLAKLKNNEVRTEAAKLADRLDSFKLGLEQGQLAGYRNLVGVSAEEMLQQIFELADAHGNAEMLQQLSNATSFQGKLSGLEPTSAAGRDQVRITQLLNALKGDGSYDTVRDNISKLTTDATTLRQMARNANLLQGLDNAQYVDTNRLLRTVGDVPAQPIQKITREWHIQQASLMKAYRNLKDEGVDPATQKKLALAMLQSFAKAAPIVANKAEELQMQTSPFFNAPNQMAEYHRSASYNPLLQRVLEDYSKDMGVNMGSAHLVDNSTFSEVLDREYGMDGVDTRIGDLSGYEQVVSRLLEKVKNGEKIPKHQVVINITDWFQSKHGGEPGKMAEMTRDLEQTFLTMKEDFLANNPTMEPRLLEMMAKLQIGAMTKHKGTDILLAPPFLSSFNRNFFDAIEHSLIHSGYRLDPIQARKAWLEVTDPDAIFKTYGIQTVDLGTAGKKTPKVVDSFDLFTQHNTFRRFEELADGDVAPYLQTLPKATANLLRGLAAYKVGEGGVDKAMQDLKLDEVLQTAYYRMLNAMASAVNYKNDLVSFMNQIEVIHQQIATILTLLEPYGPDAFGDSIQRMLVDSKGPDGKPVIPPGLEKPEVQLKASAMHSLASILGGVESMKGSNNLNVSVLKDNYYESAGAIDAANTYSVSQLDGDALRAPDGVGTRPLDRNTIGNAPLDLFVGDFHHNIALDRNHYQVENLQHHVDELYNKGLVADKFTVAIDSTIDFIRSPEIQAFLEHNKDRIKDGKLNVVLFRSAQKFDMFGIDNYYGGFSTSINDRDAFADFNERMALPEDRLKGLSFQGLSHAATSAPDDMDEYRMALMENTKRFYNGLLPGMIWSADSTSAMEVARTDDPNAVFLDIKFPGNSQAADAFYNKFKEFASLEKLPLTSRGSFGFATTNLNLIGGEKMRLTPGLDGPEVQDLYIDFFNAVYKRANAAAEAGAEKGLTGDDLNKFVADEIKSLSLEDI